MRFATIITLFALFTLFVIGNTTCITDEPSAEVLINSNYVIHLSGGTTNLSDLFDSDTIKQICNNGKSIGSFECIDNYLSSLKNLNGFCIKLFDATISDIRQHFIVSICIELDTTSSLDPISEEVIDLDSTYLWGLDRINQRDQPLDLFAGTCRFGEEIDVFVIDTGINTQHREFKNRIREGYNFVSGEDPSNIEDCFGHGTHVSSTLLGSSYGVSKRAVVHPLRVFPCFGSAPYSVIISALNWIAEWTKIHSKRGVINMSLGGGKSIALNNALEKLITDYHHIIVVAAGNNGIDACTRSPASAPLAITVGATIKPDKIAGYSNIGSCIDIVAPGSYILGGWVGGKTNSAVLSGTSMASPHVAGIAVAFLETYPNATSIDIIDMIKSSASPNKISDIPINTANLLAYIDTSVCGDPPTTTLTTTPTTTPLTTQSTSSYRGTTLPDLFYDLTTSDSFQNNVLKDFAKDNLDATCVTKDIVRVENNNQYHLHIPRNNFLIINRLIFSPQNTFRIGQITGSLWMRYTHTQNTRFSGRVVLGAGAEWFSFGIWRDGSCYFYTAINLARKERLMSSNFGDGKFHHYIFQYDGVDNYDATSQYIKRIYVDGTLQTSAGRVYQLEYSNNQKWGEYPLLGVESPQYLMIGKDPTHLNDKDPPGSILDIDIDKIRLWINKSPTENELLDTYHAEKHFFQINNV